MTSYYETLGVPADADADAIKHAFRRKAKRLHPDRNGGDAEAMAAVNEAYRVLSDPELRRVYDETGRSNRPPTLEEKARELLIAVFNDAIKEGENPVRYAHGRINDLRHTATSHPAHVAELIAQLEALKSKVESKSGSTLLKDLIDGHIARQQASLIEAQEALKMVDELTRQMGDFIDLEGDKKLDLETLDALAYLMSPKGKGAYRFRATSPGWRG